MSISKLLVVILVFTTTQLSAKEALTTGYDSIYENHVIYLHRAQQFVGLGQFDSASYWIEKNLHSPKQLNSSEATNLFAESWFYGIAIYSELGNIDRFNELVDEFTELGFIKGKWYCWITTTISNTYQQQGMYNKAIKWAELTREHLLKHQFEGSDRLLFKSLIGIGGGYFGQGRFDVARQYLKQSLLVANSLEDNLKILSVQPIHENLGLIYINEQQMDSAYQYFSSSLELVDQIKGVPQPMIDKTRAHLYWNFGKYYRELEEYEKSIEYFKKSINTYQRLFGNDHLFVFKLSVNLAESHTALQQFDEAEKYIRMCHNYAVGLQKATPDVASRISFTQALYYKERNMPDSAGYFLKKSLEVNKTVLIEGHKVYSEIYLAMKALQKFTEVLGPNPAKTELDFIYDKTVSQVNYINGYVSGIDLRELLRGTMRYLIDEYYYLYSISRDYETLEKLWVLIEISKAVQLKQQTDYSEILKNLSPELAKKEASLRDSISYCLNVLNAGNTNVDSLLFVLNERFGKLKVELRNEYPEYFQSRYEVENAMTLKSFRGQLRNGQCIVAFYEADSDVYVFQVTQSGTSLIKIDHETNSIKKYLEDHLDEQVSSITFIPDGQIWRLNFDTISYKGNYLIRHYPISYAYSATTALHPASESDKHVRALAYSYAEDNEGIGKVSDFKQMRDVSYQELPGTSLEVMQIARVLEGDYRYGKSASETRFKQEASDYDILHLAVHGELDHNEPLNSKLVFSNSGSENDGFLHLYELQNLRLHGHMAVLSACNTGMGEIDVGEGILSLGRGFKVAGIPSLILTRDAISDLTTPVLMKYFYEGLNLGMTKSEALQKAKLKFLELDADDITSDPKYWSNFYVLGADDPIVKKSTVPNYFLVAFLLISFGLGVLFLKKYR